MNRLEFFIRLIDLEIVLPILDEIGENFLINNSKICFIDKDGIKQSLDGLLIQIDSNMNLSIYESTINKLLVDIDLPFAKLYILQYPWIWNMDQNQWYIPENNITLTSIKVNKNE